MKMLDWEGRYGDADVYSVSQQFPNDLMDVTPPDLTKEPLKAPRPFAFAEHGRWIVKCPFDGCESAEFADFKTKLFFCNNCRNAQIDNRLLEVDVPNHITRAAVDDLLTRRPIPSTRNFMPHMGETVKALKKENLAMGIEA